MSYEELKKYLQRAHGYTGDISMGSYEKYLKNRGITTIPSAEVSTLSDESYNKLSDNQKQVYDAFHGAQTLPYELETKPLGRNINTVRKKDDIHWEDALRMVQDSGVKNIYNTPAHPDYKKGYKEGDFRAHTQKFNNSIYIPPSSGYTGAKDKRLKELELVKTLIEGFESGGGNYSHPRLGDGKKRPVPQRQYDYYKNERLPILLEGYENFYNNSDRQGMWYESGSLEDSSNFGVNNDYLSSLTAELAHVNRFKEQNLPTELYEFYKTQGSRAVRAIKEGKWPDSSNYKTASDLEYQTHYAPTGNEATMFSEYNLSSKILRDLAEKKLAKEKSNGGSVRSLKKYKVNKFQDGGFTENGDPTGREDEEENTKRDTSGYMDVLSTLGGLLKEYISGDGIGYGGIDDDNPKNVIQQPGNPFLNIAKHTKGIITEGLNKYIQQNIRPGDYPDTKKLLTEMLFANSDGQIPYNWESRDSTVDFLSEGFISDAPIWTDSEGDPNLDEEAYALALGRPTSNKHFRLSEHTPSKGHEEGDIYYKSPDFKWSTLLKRMQGEYVGSEKKFGAGFWDVDALGKDGQDPYQNFTAHVGEDEGGMFISYYDKYDFASPAINKIIEKGGGKPISFYDKKYVTKNSDGKLSFVDSVEEDPTLRERTSLSEYSKWQLQQKFKK